MKRMNGKNPKYSDAASWVEAACLAIPLVLPFSHPDSPASLTRVVDSINFQRKVDAVESSPATGSEVTYQDCRWNGCS